MLIKGDLFKFEVIHCGIKKATGNKIAECQKTRLVLDGGRKVRR